jgi:hypothetical protein
LNSNPGQFYFVFLLPLFRLENHVCLSHSVQMAGAAWHTAMRIMIEVEDLVQRTGDGHTGQVLGGRMIERSGGAMCGLHHAHRDEEHGFLGWASKPRSMVCQWFDPEPLGQFLIGLCLKTDGDGL